MEDERVNKMWHIHTRKDRHALETGLVSDPCNEVNITISETEEIFGFLVYTNLSSNHTIIY